MGFKRRTHAGRTTARSCQIYTTHKEQGWVKDIFFSHLSYLSEELKGRRLHLFDFIQPICCKCHGDGARQPCSMTGKDIQAWWRSSRVNYFWLKRTLRGVKFHSAVCWFSSPASKKIELWILLVHTTVLTAGQKRRVEGLFFQERKGSEKMGYMWYIHHPLTPFWGIKPFNQWGSVMFALILHLRPLVGWCTILF